MPCCAFAAAFIGQLILGLGAVRRALFGSADQSAARNDAVEWRLDSSHSQAIEAAPRWAWARRLGVRGLAVAAVVELLILFGAFYGAAEHFGHGGHAGHVHGTPSASVYEQERRSP